MIPFLVVVGIAVFIVIAAWGARQAANRRQQLAAWAASRGLDFDESRNYGFDEHHPKFEALRSGSNRYAYNIAFGQRHGRSIQGFDYHYETQSRDSKGNTTTHHHHFSAVILALDFPFEPIFIRPEGFFDKVTAFFGVEDIDFELDAFSRAFYVKCRDKKFAYDVVQPRTMELMLASQRFTMDFERDHVLIYDNSTFDPHEFDAAIALVEAILTNLPTYLRDERQARGAIGVAL